MRAAGMHPAGRALIAGWATLLLLSGGGALLLQELGAPHPRAPKAVIAGSQPLPPKSTQEPTTPAAGVGATPLPAVASIPVALAKPDLALLEPAPDYPDRMLPRIADDGRRPAQVYAAHPGAPPHGQIVAILIEGLGLSDAISHTAIDSLPAAISLGFSPYAVAFDHPPGPVRDQSGVSTLAEAARLVGHETLLSLPMEPAGSPLDDEGPQALSTTLAFDQDRRALQWTLSRLQGYVGVTNALSGLRGDRFANSGAFGIVAGALSSRGLIYVDAGTGPHAGPVVPMPDSVHADLTLDSEPDAADIEARLSRLEQLAVSQGSALGIAGPLRPVTIARLAAWSRHLGDRGITLVPVTVLLSWRQHRPDAAAPKAIPVTAGSPS
ncbi:divergent polysaccharide deacetylase family protein [Lichenicola sp.]|uniref:divergent polysaccharide deacetylase family protein n=1 Tax=Lichenicola sp. TaxID=2804529 RepID=UPI003AFFB93E